MLRVPTRKRLRSPKASHVDPYSPNSANYAERHREQVVEFPGGLVRVDYGAPNDRYR